jgi:hypothetical protein
MKADGLKINILKLILIFLHLGFSISCTKKSDYSYGGLGSYYIDSENGDDNNIGTSPSEAWKSLDRINTTIFKAGDKILIKAGTHYMGRLNPKGSGTALDPIIIDMYGDGDKPCIDAEGKYNEALLLENREYWEVNNLELTNNGTTREEFRYGAHIKVWNYGTVHHIHLKNLFVHDVNGSLIKRDPGEGHGIYWENGGDKIMSRFDGLLIEDCHLLRTDRNGICGYSRHSDRRDWFPSLNVVIRNNLLEDIGGDCIKPWGCEGALVEYNVVRGGRQRCDDYAAGIWPWSCDNTIIQFNEVSNIKGTKDGQGFDSDDNCINTIFQYNYSHDNDGGFMLLCSDGSSNREANVGCVGTIIRYNISKNDGHRTFHIAGPVKNAKIYNNVIYIGNNLDVHIFLYGDYNGWAERTSVYNNIFYVDGTGRYSYTVSRNPDGTYNAESGFGGSTFNLFNYNVFYGNHIEQPGDEHAINDDPMLIMAGSGGDGMNTVEGYKLLVNSPCMDSGMNIADNGGRDFWGNEVPYNNITDRGANEYSP